MKKYLPLALFALCSSSLFLNCNCGKRLCNNAIPVANFINFDSASLHTVIINEYSNDGKFDHLLDTRIYSNAVENGVDTLQFGGNTIMLGFFTDYSIQVPAVNKTWYIRNITSQYTHLNVSACTSGMTYYLNDTLHTVSPNSLLGNQTANIDINE